MNFIWKKIKILKNNLIKLEFCEFIKVLFIYLFTNNGIAILNASCSWCTLLSNSWGTPFKMSWVNAVHPRLLTTATPRRRRWWWSKWGVGTTSWATHLCCIDQLTASRVHSLLSTDCSEWINVHVKVKVISTCAPVTTVLVAIETRTSTWIASTAIGDNHCHAPGRSRNFIAFPTWRPLVLTNRTSIVKTRIESSDAVSHSWTHWESTCSWVAWTVFAWVCERTVPRCPNWKIIWFQSGIGFFMNTKAFSASFLLQTVSIATLSSVPISLATIAVLNTFGVSSNSDNDKKNN